MNMRTSAALAVQSHEGPVSRTQKLRLSRSPHPYHRPAVELSDRSHDANRGQLRRTPEGMIGPDYFDVDGRKRRKVSASPSNSGTEADDERSSFLKGLPAPPLRPRKGLKGLKGLGPNSVSSPLLTPSCLDDERYGLANRPIGKARLSSRSQPTTDTEKKQIREKFTKRRRAEAVRRILETLLLVGVGYLSVHGFELRFIYELRSQLLVVACVYTIYPLRVLWYQGRKVRLKSGIPILRIPVSYDPAPLLYPVFLPSFVVLSLASRNPQSVLPNIILGICSIPMRAIPLYQYGDGSVQWILSLLPCFSTSMSFKFPGWEAMDTQNDRLFREGLVFLYPLHRALLPSLGFLSTTSLLPAELQLLSVALINLLLFASSPQSIILQALLWIGGMAIFVSCRLVLRWTVELARVPSWRFRRTSHISRAKNVLARAIDETFKGALSRLHVLSARRYSSDSDDSQIPKNRWARRKSLHPMPVRSSTRQKLTKPESKYSILAADDMISLPSKRPDESSNRKLVEKFRQRRNTLPTYLPDALQSTGLVDTLSRMTPNAPTPRPKSFLSLTIAQATILKWIYAIFVYLVVAATIAFPIRTYISRKSLQGKEPVGWAIGYLFGDIPAFRLQVVLMNLESWVCLPQRAVESSFPICSGEQFRNHVLGPANTRLLISGYCAASIIVGLIVVFQLTAVVEVDTRRKVFHGMMVVMFLPTIFLDPPFAALALILILAIFLLLDLFRASQLPPISKPLTHFLAPYVDGRDHRGPIIVSHIFLLIGCATPLWLSLAGTERSGDDSFAGWDVKTRDLSMVSGIVCVGMGDAAASLVGRRYGRRRWPWSGGKSLEGSLAFSVAVVIGLGLARIWLLLGGWAGDSGDGWAVTLVKAMVAALGSSLTEAVLTGGNDNVIVPVVLWLLVRGLRM